MVINNIFDIAKNFKTEKDCHQYLASQRWFDGVIVCPHCNNEQSYVFKDGIRYECRACKKQFTAKTKTFMEGSKLKTVKWLMAMFLTMHKKGISSVQLAKDIAVTQKTAWFMLQRIRAAFANEKKVNLTGVVEIDECFVGGKNKNRHYSRRMKYKELTGRTYPDKTTVFGMYERGTGKVRAMVVSRQEFRSLGRIITYNIQPGSTLMTDDWNGYNGALDKIYKRHSIDHSKWKYVDGEVTTNRMENFWSHFKRGMHSTYISVNAKHLNKYVQEFAFRFNNRNFGIQQQMNNVLAMGNVRLKYKDLIAA
jgi:transposase-like protein